MDLYLDSVNFKEIEEAFELGFLTGLARRDETIPARVAATQALAEFGYDRAERVLKEIAERDEDQNVRYTAERILLDYRKQKEREAARPRLNGTSN